MKTKPEQDELLDDVFKDAAETEFRAALFTQTLQAAQQRNRNRQRTRGVIVAVCALFMTLGVFKMLNHSNTPSLVAESNLMVHTSELGAGMLIRTQPNTFDLITPLALTAGIVHTQPDFQTFRMIDDEQLFALINNRPAALIQNGPAIELVFINPTDREGFRVQ
jgi:hypothetical protein